MPINTHKKSKLASARSTESIYSSASSKSAAKVLFQRKSAINIQKKQQQNLEEPQSATTNSTNLQEQLKFQKNVSARFYRVKSFQNQLNEAQNTINNLTAENRMLLTLHQRQEVALAKYEAANEDLPKLINSHAEEVRIWEIKCSNIRNNIKELEERLTKKDTLIFALREQKNYFAQLSKNKQLEERKTLNEQRLALEAQLADIKKHTKQAVWRLEAELKHLKQLVAAEEKKLRLGAYEMEKMRIQLGCYKPSNMTAQKVKNLSFTKDQAELTETSVPESSDTISKRVPRLQNPLAVNFMNNQHSVATSQGNSISEDVSSMQSCEDAPASCEMPNKSDAELNSCVSNCSFSLSTNPNTDCSISEDEQQLSQAEEFPKETNGDNINKLLASLKSTD